MLISKCAFIKHKRDSSDETSADVLPPPNLHGRASSAEHANTGGCTAFTRIQEKYVLK